MHFTERWRGFLGLTLSQAEGSSSSWLHQRTGPRCPTIRSPYPTTTLHHQAATRCTPPDYSASREKCWTSGWRRVLHVKQINRDRHGLARGGSADTGSSACNVFKSHLQHMQHMQKGSGPVNCEGPLGAESRCRGLLPQAQTGQAILVHFSKLTTALSLASTVSSLPP